MLNYGLIDNYLRLMVPEQENLNTPEGPEVEPATPETSAENNAETPPSAEAEVVTPAVENESVETTETAEESPAAEVETTEEVKAEAPAAAPEVEPASEEKTEAPVVEEPAKAEASSEEKAEGEAEAEESTEAEAAPVEFTEDKGEEAATNLLEEILGEQENLDTVIEKATPQELCLLMESIATRGEVADFVSKIANIKKSFESKVDPETVETVLLSRFNTALARFNKKRMAYYAEREKEKEVNSGKKFELLEKLKAIVSEEEVTKIAEVREIQNQWREIGWVLQKDLQALNETYRQYLDVFYKLRSQYQGLVDLDRKYNLEEKNKVVAEIEGLIPTDDQTTREEWGNRSTRVKQLQEYWRAIGHVPREDMEALNSSFRDVLDRFYEMRSGYYEVQDAQKGENAEKKKVLLEKLKPYSAFEGNKPKAWNDATKEILDIQQEWKAVGPGPIDVNKQLWKDYRAECDAFFNKKAAFFAAFDEERAANLAKKTTICEQAEAVMDSEDFKVTADLLKKLQAEWKDVGPVHDRYSNKIWKRFRKACDHFFEKKSAQHNANKTAFEENLKIKLDLIAQVEALAASENPKEHAAEFEAMQAKWKETGHVPFKQKDKINGAFREALSRFYDKSGLGRGNRNGGGNRGGGYNKRGGGRKDASTGNPFEDEMRKLRMKIKVVQEKVEQYELNIQFISKGKSGDALRNQIQGMIDAEKATIDSAKKKIKEVKAKKEAAEKAAKAEKAAPKAEETAPVKEEAPKTEEATPAKEEAPKAEDAAPAKEEAPKAEEATPAKEEAPKAEEASSEENE